MKSGARSCRRLQHVKQSMASMTYAGWLEAYATQAKEEQP